MDIIKLIKSRCAVRHFSSKELDESTTKHIISLPDDNLRIGGLALGHIEEKHTKKMRIKTEKHYH